MILFLLIVYWIQENREEIVTGMTATNKKFDYNKGRREYSEAEQEYSMAQEKFKRQLDMS